MGGGGVAVRPLAEGIQGGRPNGVDFPVVAGTQKDCQRGLHYPGLQYELLSKSNYGILSYAE